MPAHQSWQGRQIRARKWPGTRKAIALRNRVTHLAIQRDLTDQGKIRSGPVGHASWRHASSCIGLGRSAAHMRAAATCGT